jgi:hypothetical protein
MEKSTITNDYRALYRLLRQARADANVTQVELAKQLRIEPASLHSQWRHGESMGTYGATEPSKAFEPADALEVRGNNCLSVYLNNQQRTR